MEWRTIERIGIALTAIISIGGVGAMTGFSLTSPYALADDVKESDKSLQTQIDEIKDGLKNINLRQETQDKRQLRIQRVQLAQQLREAQEDLRLNPNSSSAARAVEEARTALAEIDRALQELPR